VITVVLFLLVLTAIGYVLLSRLQGRPVDVRRLPVLPTVLSVIGLLQVMGMTGHGVRPVDVLLIGAGVAVPAVMGAARGATVAVFARDGQPWLRYRPATLALWGATLAARGGIAAIAFAAGAPLATREPAILLSVGITLLAEAVVVVRRAFSIAESGWQAQAWRHHVAMR
jgi:hypothetical protein